MIKKGKFIVVEGLEGAGKTTVIKFISSILLAAKINFITVHEPGTSIFGNKIREILKDPASDILPTTELLLLTANRLELIEKIIMPALEHKQWVVGDRHFLSTLAYQGGGRGLALEYITEIHDLVTHGFEPDLYLYLDIDPALGLQRAAARGKLDRFEQENLAFFTRAREIFLQTVKHRSNAQLIDASQPLDQVQHDIAKILYNLYPELCQ